MIRAGPELSRAEAALRRFAAGLPSGLEHSFGLEAKVAYRLLSRPGVGEREVGLLRKSLLRPAPEPIIATYWASLSAPMSVAALTALTACLLGQPTAPRTGPVHGAEDSGGVTVIYPPPETGPSLVRSILLAGEVSALAAALVRLVEVMLAHPFLDGNGRLARALWLGPLIDGVDLPGPFLPIGPLMKWRASQVVGAIRTVGTRGDPEPFFNVMIDILDETMAETKALLASGEPTGLPR